MNIRNSKKIHLVLLTSLDTELQMKVREIRNEENVRKWMHTDHSIGVNEHLTWINRLKSDDKQIVFVVMDDQDQKPVGVVSVNGIDLIHKKTDWAFYLIETARGGLGSALEFAFINFIFEILEIEKLNCEVIEGNDAVIKLHKKFLFHEEGFRRSNILKNNIRTGVYFLGLNKEEWLLGRNEIKEKYKNVFEKFTISIEWKDNEQKKHPHPIDQIEAARTKNNLNWMSILRLALEKSPEVAKPIISEIKRIDREISIITDKLFADS